MAGRVSRIGRTAAMLLAVPLASGCASIVNHRGYIADELLLRSVQAGIDNRQSVEKTLGRPSFVSQFGPPVWYYTASNTRQAPFTSPRIYENAVFAVHFDQAGNVASVERSGMERVARINPEDDSTPTLGRERGFLEDLFGNIGAVGTAGGGGGGGGGG
jgi:outer membrane protein assembly factor BamE (lipoprotein component of BamABCDE complex)